MVSNNMSGIEKLKELADQIEREHASKLQAFYERYETDLREAREARDIAIKEAEEYNHQLGDIIKYLGSCSRKKPVLSSQGRYERIMSELYKRLMPPGMEWPRFEDGMKITWDDAPEDITAVCLALDGSCYSLHYDMPDDERMCIYEASDRVKRPVTEVLGADGLPIKVGETVYLESFGRPFTVVGFDGAYLKDANGGYLRADCATHTPPDTQERIDEDVCKISDECTYFSSDGSCVKCKLVAACPGVHELERMVVSDLLRRQRELDARTIGGE